MSLNQSQPNVKENESTEVKQYFINDDKFQLIKQCQQHIYEEVQVVPAFRKMVNDLITEENLAKLKMKYMAVWKE